MSTFTDENKTAVSADDLEKIAVYSRRPLREDEVYTFSVILCDNETDRDFEHFSIDSLEEFSQMFKGVCGIFDHTAKARDQVARIFDTEIIQNGEIVTSHGEPYTALRARCYMPKNDGTAALISEIDSGIKKEVSIGCRVERRICSVCGADTRREMCGHRAGEIYDDKLCTFTLDGASDAYEWSFVAVPAQRKAGVTKHFEPSSGFTEKEGGLAASDELYTVLKNLEAAEALLDENRKRLKSRVTAMAALGLPSLDTAEFAVICDKLSYSELGVFEKAFAEKLPPCGTVQTVFTEKSDIKNQNYMI